MGNNQQLDLIRADAQMNNLQHMAYASFGLCGGPVDTRLISRVWLNGYSDVAYCENVRRRRRANYLFSNASSEFNELVKVTDSMTVSHMCLGKI